MRRIDGTLQRRRDAAANPHLLEVVGPELMDGRDGGSKSTRELAIEGGRANAGEKAVCEVRPGVAVSSTDAACLGDLGRHLEPFVERHMTPTRLPGTPKVSLPPRRCAYPVSREAAGHWVWG